MKSPDLNDLNEGIWPASPNVDTESLEEWRLKIMYARIMDLKTVSDSTKMYENFIANGQNDEDKEWRSYMVDPAYYKDTKRKMELLVSLLDMGPIFL